ncbi:MAG TPA: hypothetical protein VM621_02515 [Luteibacter sp.]|uniref:hypothetical protein n=1 Tax=Luteibacter sp. TaxID=1886636 RepID=UPI002B66599D|nr:hypothetical protein [Luteibacter sp.]HVI53910.1 hypothetical protein [Luteibacter sp.]
MNARPYIFGCLCLVGAAGTAAASDIDPTGGLLSLGGSVSSSFDSNGARSSSGSRDTSASDVMSNRSSGTPQRNGGPAPTPSPVDPEDGPHDGAAPMRSPAPSWQSMLPGSML